MPVAMTPELLWTLPRVGAPVSAGAGRVVVPVTTYDIEANTGTTRIWLVNDDLTRVPLTAPEFNASKPAVDVVGSRLAFVATVGDEKVKQIYVANLDEEAHPDTTGPLTSFPLGTLGARWLPGGQGLIALSYLIKGHLDLGRTRAELERRRLSSFSVHVTENTVYRYWDTWLTTGEVPHLFHVDEKNGALTDLTPGSTRWWAWPNTDEPLDSFDISPDGRHIAYVADSSVPPHRKIRRCLYELDRTTGDEFDHTPEGAVQVHRPRYSPDGTTITYGFQVGPDHYGDPIRLGVYDRAGGIHRRIAESWDRSADHWVFDGRGDLLIVAEDLGHTHLFRLAGDDPEPELIAPGGSLGSPVVDGDGTVFLLSHNLRQPPEVERLGANGALLPVTEFARELLVDVAWGEVEDLTYAGADGEAVQMFLIHPPTSTVPTTGLPPLLHLIHGGPYGAFNDSWQWRWHAQSFAARGYLVAMVNFHGSSSFGESFALSIHGGWGDKPFRDIEAATDLLVSEGRVDEARMAVAGGSYGGYMVAFITGQTNRYVCAVAHAAVTNLGGTYSSDITGGLALGYGAEIFEDRARVERYSPSSHASGYNTPTLVIHGERDFRVPSTQGLELYGVLKAKEVPARLVFYPGENHWILNPQPSLHWYGEVFSWLNLYLK